MKYAFIFGTNAFMSNQPVLSFNDNGTAKGFLTIKQFINPNVKGSFLAVDIDITDLVTGHQIKLTDNKAEPFSGILIERNEDEVKVFRTDGSTIINVHQLSEPSVHGLSHHINAELDTQNPAAVIRINGNFRVGSYYISAGNEKLFIDDNSYAESVLACHHQGIMFADEGVVL